MQDDEEALVARAKTDPQAFGVIYDRYMTRIYRFAYRRTGNQVLAEEVTGATFEKALRHIRDFEWRGKSVAAWLYRIARNEAVSRQRRQRLREKMRLVWPAGQSNPGRNDQRDLETGMIAAENRRALHAALAQLPAGDYEIIQLSYFEDLSGEEVAEVLNCSRNAAYVRRHRALQRLKEQLTTINSQIPTENG